MTQTSASFASSQRRGTISQVTDRWKDALSKNDLCDVQFAVGRQFGSVKILDAHKLALSISSDVFHTMFYGSLAEKGDTAIDIPDIPSDAFSNMLSYIYTGSVSDINPENALQTLYCADKYDLPWLAELCTDFIRDGLNADNCLMYLENAQRWTPDCDVVMEKCWDIIDVFSVNVLQSEYFNKLERTTLERILQRNTLSAEENAVYRAVEKWAEAGCISENLPISVANRRMILGPAFFLVRFPLLTDAQLTSGPVKSGLLSLEEMRTVLLQKHKADGETAKEGPPKFPKKPRQCIMCPFASKYVYKRMEKVFVLYNNDYFYPAEVTKDNECAMYGEYEVEKEREEGEASRQHMAVRSADILRRGLPVEAHIDGGYKEATYGALRAGRHTVSVAGREHNVGWVELRIAGQNVDEWKAAQK
ncbi:BTB/POZ domain-containing protein 6-like isoform X2 [Paramacrobiotus metropolitanus]|uniref:BTB/POZ domain-containing protein 6-like isoform X2 n=1 Tax=Paramacrobiotus metropolitanus TaxID=2943436 RepID=UPI002445ABE5|nr:BTB/POZ domain-containing protein 6-like isoform X2 [Paramacrobiotus metropolitanus]